MTATRTIITTFGYRHAAAPQADLTLDLRRCLRDPAVASNPALLHRTGLDPEVRDYVLATDGAEALVSHLTGLIEEFPEGVECHVATGCAGGRHRSVALGEAVARALLPAVIAEIRHRDHQRPILPPAPLATGGPAAANAPTCPTGSEARRR